MFFKFSIFYKNFLFCKLLSKNLEHGVLLMLIFNFLLANLSYSVNTLDINCFCFLILFSFPC